MAYGELIDLESRRDLTAKRHAASARDRLRRRAPFVFGLLVGLPISALLWVALIVGIRSLL